MSAIVFGEADPMDYREPLCFCGHERADHQGDIEGEALCWHGWHDSVEGCRCLEYVPDLSTGRATGP